jgi:hypothetical protein
VLSHLGIGSHLACSTHHVILASQKPTFWSRRACQTMHATGIINTRCTCNCCRHSQARRHSIAATVHRLYLSHLRLFGRADNSEINASCPQTVRNCAVDHVAFDIQADSEKKEECGEKSAVVPAKRTHTKLRPCFCAEYIFSSRASRARQR